MGKKTILIVLGAGGHTKQLLRLVKSLGDYYNYEYVIGFKDKISENKIEFKGRIFKIINPRKMSDKNIFKIILKFIPSTIQTIYFLSKSKSKTILVVGPALCLHIAVIGKYLFNKKIIFLESWSRVYNKSWAGKALYGIADLFFVQWPQQLNNYPKAIYAGRLG